MAIDLVRARLAAQRLIGARFPRPVDVVAHFGAVQAQDYRGALWGIAQRTDGAREADVEAALEARVMIRTWPMRGTLHFVAAADARWLTRMLAPRVIRRAASRYRELQLDARTLAKARRVVERALAGRTLTRAELYAALARGGVSPAGQRGVHVVGWLAMHGVVCLARGQTLALLDEWIPRSRELVGDEALGELARRYVASHGPALDRDVAWWTGLTLTEARRALAIAAIVAVDGYYRVRGPTVRRAPRVHLLPAYDEYTVAFRDRAAILDPAHAAATRNGIFSPVVLVDGRIAGTWKRVKGQVVVSALHSLPSVAEAVAGFQRFLSGSRRADAPRTRQAPTTPPPASRR